MLNPGKTPHEPHEHKEEELLIVLSGEPDLVIVHTKPVLTERRHRLRPGSFVYYPAYQRHTIHNAGALSATYLMFKWHSDPVHNNQSTLNTSIVEITGEGPSSDSGKSGFIPRCVLEGGTQYLRKFHCHVTTLQPGSGYPPHVDAYDVAIVVLRGSVETLGRTVGPNGVIFYAAGEPHGMKNVGASPAVYLVFEFHGSNSSVPGIAYPLFRRRLARIKSLARLPRRIGGLVRTCISVLGHMVPRR